MPYLVKDIFSLADKTKCYGQQGAEVILIREDYGVMLVKLKDGASAGGFCVLRDEVSDTPVMSSKDSPEVVPPYVPKSSPGRRRQDHSPSQNRPSDQGSLF